MDLDAKTVVLGLVGLAWAGVVGNAAYDGIRRGANLMARIAKERRARIATREAKSAVEMASEVRLLVLWVSQMLFSFLAMGMACMSLVCLGLAMAFQEGDAPLAFVAAGVLFMVLFFLADRAMRRLFRVAEHLNVDFADDPLLDYY